MVATMWRSILLLVSLLCLNCYRTFACQNGWIQNETFCYMFSHTKVTWSEATSVCKALGAILAEPDGQSMDAFLVGESIANHRIHWLGGSDLVIEGQWKWTSTEENFEYTNWIPGDPNNANAGEDCLINNWSGDGKWADYDCEKTEYFVCQKPVGESQIGVIG